MTIDKSLKRRGGLARSRNVLKRGERIEQMKAQETWVEGQSALGIPKTRVIKITAGKKKKVKKEEDAGGAAKGKAAKGAAKGAAAKGAAAPKGAAPKGAAPKGAAPKK